MSSSLEKEPELSPLEMVPELHVVISGLPRKGKSTSLNNIFDLDLPAELSARPVTKQVVPIKIERNGISLTITDTPGLRAANASKDDEATLDCMKKCNEIPTLFFLVLSVSPDSCINADYCQMLKNLTSILGHGIWDWCLILLTFSDVVCENEHSSVQEKQSYQEYLTQHCMKLQETLAEIGICKKVRPFFEYTDADHFESLDGVVAIPIGKFPDIPTKELFPLQPWTHKFKWTDLVFMEIVKINREVQHREKLTRNMKIQEINRRRSALIQFKYQCCTIQSIVEAGKNGAVKGARVGIVAGEFAVAAIGAVVGYSMGLGISQGVEMGRRLGMPIGAVAGATIVGGTAATIVTIKYLIEQRKIKELEQEMKTL